MKKVKNVTLNFVIPETWVKVLKTKAHKLTAKLDKSISVSQVIRKALKDKYGLQD